MTEANERMSKRLCLGIDLGGTNLAIGLVDEDGTLLDQASTPTECDQGPAHVIQRMAQAGGEMIKRAPDGADVVCVGVGSPGPLDSDRGVIFEAGNLWPDRNVEMKRDLSALIGLPVSVNNDANCAAWGEYCAGAGRGADTMIVFTLGTGVGGGIVINGRLFKGVSDAAGEVGHMTIDYDSDLPYFRNRGALEDHASATGLSRFARMAIESGADTMLTIDPGDPTRPTAKDVYDAAEAGDAVAAEALERVARLLGVGAANIINILNPDRIVFTGGMTAAWDRLSGPMIDEAGTRAFEDPFRACEFRRGELWQDAGVIGAASLAMIELDEKSGD